MPTDTTIPIDHLPAPEKRRYVRTACLAVHPKDGWLCQRKKRHRGIHLANDLKGRLIHWK